MAPASVVLDSDGTGSCTVSPSGTDWLVMHTSVSTSTAVLKSRCDIILNGESDPFEGTHSGSRDSSDTRHLVMAGETITAKWTGGDAGARATLRVSGVQVQTGHGVALLIGG